MTTTTRARLRRTAVEAVGSIPGIEAVVLYGSRARGTARAASDWDGDAPRPVTRRARHRNAP